MGVDDVDNELINFLKFVRDVFDSYSNLVDTLMQSKEKYGFDPSKNLSKLSDPESLHRIFTSLPNDKLGLLVSTMLELNTNQEKLQTIMELNENELSSLNESLKKAASNLRKIVGE